MRYVVYKSIEWARLRIAGWKTKAILPDGTALMMKRR